MKRGLAGLITVLLFSAFVALGAAPTEQLVSTEQLDSSPRSATSQTSPAHDGHLDHSHDGVRSLARSGKSTDLPESATSASSNPDAASGASDLPDFSSVCGPSARPSLVGRTVSCTHGGDHYFGSTSSGAVTAQNAAPTCHGDGVTGRRVRLIYAYPDGAPDRSAEVVPQIADAWAPAIEGLVRAESKSAGTELGVRFFMPGCALDVRTVKVSASTADTSAGTDAIFDRITNSLAAQGADDYTQKYLIWFDGFSGGAACGIAHLLPIDDSPLPSNSHNGVAPVTLFPGLQPGWTFGSPNYAVTFRKAGAFAGPDCWGRNGAHTETHELFHTLGAVQLSAPNSDGAGHCLDALDVMCYDSNLSAKPMRPSCFGGFAFLDCNKDDYFNPRPAAGSYLSTHWNTANSGFLAEIGPLNALPLP